MFTKEALLALMTSASGKFQDAMKARISKAYEAIVTDDSCGSTGYSPFLLGGIGRGRKWIGGRVYTKLQSMGVRFDCEKYEKTVEIDLDTLNDDPSLSGAKIAGKLVESVDLTDEFEVIDVLKSNKSGFDAEPLFGTHEYVSLGADGKPTLVGGNPVVLGSYTNDVAPAVPGDAVDAYFYGSKPSIIRVTRSGEDFAISMKGGSPEQSEHTFDNDTVVWGWRARKIYRPGLPFYTLRCTVPLSADQHQANKDLMATFINDAGQVVSNKPTHLFVKAGSQAAAAARKIFVQQFLANGESNIYAGDITVVEIGTHLL